MGLGLRTLESIPPTGGCPSAVRTLRTSVSFSWTSKLLSIQTRLQPSHPQTRGENGPTGVSAVWQALINCISEHKNQRKRLLQSPARASDSGLTVNLHLMKAGVPVPEKRLVFIVFSSRLVWSKDSWEDLENRGAVWGGFCKVDPRPPAAEWPGWGGVPRSWRLLLSEPSKAGRL